MKRGFIEKARYVLAVLFGILVFGLMTGNNTMAKTLPTNVTTPADGNALVGVEGSYATDVKAAIDLVNKYRLEACTKGYPDPRDPDRKLKKSDYVPIKWSSDLEYIARIRAAEASIYSSHERPNGKSCFSISAENGVSSYAEVLAWGGTSIVSSVSLWYTEKSTWIKQADGVTGHYTSMINPDNTYMGMANFDGTGAGEFTNELWLSYDTDDVVIDETPLPKAKNVIQTVEVKKSDLSSRKIDVDKTFVLGVYSNIRFSYKYGTRGVKVYDLADCSWSSKSSKVKVLPDGRIKPLQVGKYTIKFRYSGDRNGTVTKKITILPKTPVIKKVTTGSSSAKVRFSKVSGVSGYEIKYIYGSFWYPTEKKVRVSKTATTKQIKDLTGNTSYGFCIRSYKKVGNKTYYSDWSNMVYKDIK